MGKNKKINLCKRCLNQDCIDRINSSICDNVILPSSKKIIKRKTYVSQLFVTTDKSLELINPKLNELSK